MSCSECGAPIDDAPTCRYCGAPRVHARDHGWRDTDKTIDVGELCEWILGKLERRGMRPTDPEQLRILRGAVVAAIRRDDPEVRIQLTLSGPKGAVEVAELLTRTAARSLFARVSDAVAREREQTHAERQRAAATATAKVEPREEPARRPETFWDKPSMPYVVTAAVMVVAFAFAALVAVASHHDHGDARHAPMKSEGHH